MQLFYFQHNFSMKMIRVRLLSLSVADLSEVRQFIDRDTLR